MGGNHTRAHPFSSLYGVESCWFFSFGVFFGRCEREGQNEEEEEVEVFDVGVVSTFDTTAEVDDEKTMRAAGERFFGNLVSWLLDVRELAAGLGNSPSFDVIGRID